MRSVVGVSPCLNSLLVCYSSALRLSELNNSITLFLFGRSEGFKPKDTWNFAAKFVNKKYAERIESNKPLLLYEAKVLRLLESSSLGIPKIFYAGQEGEYNLIVTELLGPSLHDLQKFVGKQFTLQTSLLLAIETVKLLKHVHEKGFLHRDLKPANICVG